MQHIEREIYSAVELCDAKGQLNPEAIGFARRPLIISNLKGNFLRKKKWNYWCVFGEDIVFSAAVSHLGYATVCFVYFLNYETQRFYEKTVILPFSRKCVITNRALETCKFQHSEMDVEFLYTQNSTRLTVQIDDFDGELLRADLDVTHSQNHDSLNVVVPWDRQTFQFTGKHLCLPTSGTVKVGSQLYNFEPVESFAVLNTGRGIWPRKTSRNWAMASQRSAGKTIGLNFGGKWTDGTGMTENAFFVNGTLHKIHEDILFHYDRNDYKERWQISTKFSDDVNLEFTPFFERVSNKDIKLAKSEVHQLFGYYDGYVRYADGRKLRISQLLGSIEEQEVIW